MANGISIFSAISNALIVREAPVGLQSPLDRGRSWFRISEPFTGAWQHNMEVKSDNLIPFGAVFSAVTLIAADVGKVGIRMVERDKNGIWSEVNVSAFSPVLKKPNKWQNRIKFFEQWVISKLLNGNAYILKERDGRDVVVAMYVLDPNKVKALVAPNGDVYYELRKDNLSGLEDDTVIVPASEIIHDTMVALYHPLCGVSPLTACGLAASHGLTIQENSARFFNNDSTPGGILTAPGAIDEPTARRIKEVWEANMTGENRKRIAVMGDGMTYTQMTVSASDAQMMEQLKWDERNVCTAFHVPPYMIGIGDMPTYTNIEALNQQYYTQCLQTHIESIELCLDEGLGLTEHKDHVYGTEFDLDDLLRMDTATKVKTAIEGLKGLFTTNEARKKFDLKPVKGGDAVLAQQQNFSLEAIAKRDAKDDPFAKADNAAVPAPPGGGDDENNTDTVGRAANMQLMIWEAKQAVDDLDPIQWPELDRKEAA